MYQPFRLLTIITTSAISVFALIMLLITRPDNTALTWWEKRASMSSYEAPLHLCDSVNDPVPHSYFIFLHMGYTLEQHAQAVGHGTDLNSDIEHIFPETDRHGLYYSVELDDASLDLVRADIGVDMVECNMRVWLVDSVYEADAGFVYEPDDYAPEVDPDYEPDDDLVYNADL